MKKLLMISILFFLVSCGPKNPQDVLDGDYYVSDLGFYVSIPDSLYTHGLWSKDWVLWSKEDINYELLKQLDYQITECIKKNVNIKDAWSIASDLAYILIDDYCFFCFESDTRLCAGKTDMESYIKASIYSRWRGNSYPTFQTAPHLIRTKEDMAEWTGMEAWIIYGANYYAADEPTIPVICHELEHNFYGGNYGDSVRFE